MINPVLSNFIIQFSDDFFPNEIITKYDRFLFHKNYPFKKLKNYFYETIQNLDIPGISLQEISANALNNLGKNPSKDNFPHTTINRQYPGTSPINSIVDSTKINITFRNTILNWLYCYEVLHKYYNRTRSIKDFRITLTMLDSSELPMIRFTLSDCFISTMPGLSFSYNQPFNQSKTFDIGFTFNKFDLECIIPDFDLSEVNLNNIITL